MVSSRKILVIVISAIILALGIGIFVLMLQGQGALISGTHHGATQAGTGFEYQGKWYPFRDDLQTILVMGLDKYQRPDESWGYLNNQQADFLMLLIVDQSSGTCNILHLNRDTMTKINRLGVAGDAAGTFTGQLALAHTYGSGGSDSCLNATKAVSNLLCGIRIDHYITMTMEAVETITDYIGGVEVKILDDFTAYDPEMIQGENVLLNGKQALSYVRIRSELEDSSNLHRMERQRQFLNAFYKKLLDCGEEDDDYYTKLMLSVSDSIVSDCSVTQLSTLMEQMKNCSLNSISPLAGEAVKGEKYMEFYVDEQSLKSTIISLFCQS